MRNKTDRNDARGIAQMMRLGWYRAVHVENIDMQKMRSLLANRKLLKRKLIDIENHIRGTLRAYGLLMGAVGRGATKHTSGSSSSSDSIFSVMLRPCWMCDGRSSKATKDCIACFFSARRCLPPFDDGAWRRSRCRSFVQGRCR
jgi:hypothetical protein